VSLTSNRLWAGIQKQGKTDIRLKTAGISQQMLRIVMMADIASNGLS
jgi:hypothetical protein